MAAEVETALETILNAGMDMSPDDKIETMCEILKGIKHDEFTRPIHTFLVMTKLSSKKRLEQIEDFIENRKQKLANQQQFEIKKRKLNYELARPWGEKRANVDQDPYERNGRGDMNDDECRCDACCVKMDWCCLFPKAIRPTLTNGIRWLFFLALVLLVFRYLWYSAGRAY